jgi:hypothetical protein
MFRAIALTLRARLRFASLSKRSFARNCFRRSRFASDVFRAARRKIRTRNGDRTLHSFTLVHTGSGGAHRPAMEFNAEFTTDLRKAHRGIHDESQKCHEHRTNNDFGSL